VSLIRRYLGALFPARREERGLALFLYAFLTVMVLSDWVGKVTADSLFVKRLGVEWLPLMFVLTPVAMLLTSALLFAVIDRVRRRTLLIGYLVTVMLLAVAIQLALPLGGPILGASYIFGHGVKETIYLVFWVYAGNLYDSEQANRLFPLFAGAVLVGKIIGAPVATALTALVHAEYMIGASAAGFAVALVMLVLYRDLPEGRGRHVERKRGGGLRESLRDSVDGYRAVGSDRLLRTLGVNVFFWYMLMQVGSYLYYVGLDASTQRGLAQQSEDLFVQLYSSVYASASLVALGVQIFITPILLRVLGVAWSLFAFPVWYVLTYGAAIVQFNLVTSVAIQLGERIWIPAIHRPMTELVYGQVSSRIRPRARAFLSGGVNAMGNVAAAGLIIAVNALRLSAEVLPLATVLSAAFVANTALLRRDLGVRIGLNLTSSDPELRQNAVQMLETEGRTVPTDTLRRVMSAPAPDVEHGVRLALTRRGAIAVAADASTD
jgi:AAA family ATP:ADP antiporter